MSKLITFASELLGSETLQKEFLVNPENVMRQRGLSSKQIDLLKDRKQAKAVQALSEELHAYEQHLKQVHKNSW